ncbi:hypothetical protein RI367_000251 [Sorochytrium milnesiophthora]
MPSPLQHISALEDCDWSDVARQCLVAARAKHNLVFEHLSLCALDITNTTPTDVLADVQSNGSLDAQTAEILVRLRASCASLQVGDLTLQQSLYVHLIAADEHKQPATPSERYCAAALLTGQQIASAQALLAIDMGDIKRGVKLLPRGSKFIPAVQQILQVIGQEDDMWSLLRCESRVSTSDKLAACLHVDFVAALQLYQMEPSKKAFTALIQHCIQHLAKAGLMFVECRRSAQEMGWFSDFVQDHVASLPKSQRASLYMLYFTTLIKSAPQNAQDWVTASAVATRMEVEGYAGTQTRKTMLAQYQTSVPSFIRQRAKDECEKLARDIQRDKHISATTKQSVVTPVLSNVELRRSTPARASPSVQPTREYTSHPDASTDQIGDVTMDIDELGGLDSTPRASSNNNITSTAVPSSPFTNPAMADVPFPHHAQRKSQHSRGSASRLSKVSQSSASSRRSLTSVGLGESSPFSVRALPARLAELDRVDAVPAPAFPSRSKLSTYRAAAASTAEASNAADGDARGGEQQDDGESDLDNPFAGVDSERNVFADTSTPELPDNEETEHRLRVSKPSASSSLKAHFDLSGLPTLRGHTEAAQPPAEEQQQSTNMDMDVDMDMGPTATESDNAPAVDEPAAPRASPAAKRRPAPAVRRRSVLQSEVSAVLSRQSPRRPLAAAASNRRGSIGSDSQPESNAGTPSTKRTHRAALGASGTRDRSATSSPARRLALGSPSRPSAIPTALSIGRSPLRSASNSSPQAPTRQTQAQINRVTRSVARSMSQTISATAGSSSDANPPPPPRASTMSPSRTPSRVLRSTKSRLASTSGADGTPQTDKRKR